MTKNWEQYKRELCAGNQDVATKWWKVEDWLFPQKYPKARLALMENGDGHTFVGKVRKYH